MCDAISSLVNTRTNQDWPYQYVNECESLAVVLSCSDIHLFTVLYILSN